jgi:hypothetical protein
MLGRTRAPLDDEPAARRRVLSLRMYAAFFCRSRNSPFNLTFTADSGIRIEDGMRVAWIVGLAGLSIGIAAAHPAAIRNLLEAMHPTDPALRRALDQCALEDSSFNRLDPEAREACYRWLLPTIEPEAAGTRLPVPPANFVDLWRAAGWGHISPNDVRAEQQTDRHDHPVAPAAR